MWWEFEELPPELRYVYGGEPIKLESQNADSGQRMHRRSNSCAGCDLYAGLFSLSMTGDAIKAVGAEKCTAAQPGVCTSAMAWQWV